MAVVAVVAAEVITLEEKEVAEEAVEEAVEEVAEEVEEEVVAMAKVVKVAEVEATEEERAVVESNFAQGRCSYGDSCRFSHST